VNKSVTSQYQNGKPPHHLKSAKSPKYDPNVSQFFVVSQEELAAMSGKEIQEIFRHRHILVPGHSTDIDFDQNGLSKLGGLKTKRQIQGEHIKLLTSKTILTKVYTFLNKLVNHLRSIEKPDNMLREGTMEDILHMDANGNRPILNLLDLPMGGHPDPDPTQFR
jgi:hypothetical protein